MVIKLGQPIVQGFVKVKEKLHNSMNNVGIPGFKVLSEEK